jgi:hypothetical protein
MNHHPDGVIGGTCELHRRMAAFHRCLAKSNALRTRAMRAQEDRMASVAGMRHPFTCPRSQTLSRLHR